MRHVYLLFFVILTILIAGCGVMQQPGTLRSEPVETEPAQAEEKTEDIVEEPEQEYTVPEASHEPEPEPEPEMSFDEEKEKAIAVAKQELESLAGFNEYRGRGTNVLNAAKSGCEGCWIVEMTFMRDRPYYPDKTEKIRVNMKLKDWEMDTYTFE